MDNMANKNQAAERRGGGKNGRSVPQGLNPIKPPPAPPLMVSAEVGAPVAQDQAIREKLRLYPRATINEIVAMFELDGVKVSPAAVRKAKRK
jgi:hypothetical protein